MLHNFLLFFVFCLFASFIIKIVNIMINDKNALIRFIGYIVAIVIAIGGVLIVLYCFFNINLLSFL